MTTLLRSDPSGIIAQQRDSAEENTGNAMTAYVRTMLVSGRDTQIGNIMGQLKLEGGSDVVGNFNDPSDGHNNARNLGYFTGAIGKGLAAISSDRGNLTNNLVAVAGGVATVFGMRNAFEGIIGVAVDKGSSILGGSNLGSFSSRQDAIADSFRVLAWPVPEIPDSGAARSQMQDAVNAFNAERNNVR